MELDPNTQVETRPKREDEQFSRSVPSIQCPLCQRPWRLALHDITVHGKRPSDTLSATLNPNLECLDDAVTSLSKKSSVRQDLACFGNCS